MTEHTVRQYDVQLEELRAKVLEMGGLVETQVALATEAFTGEGDASTHDIINRDDEVDRCHLAIDERCGEVIARRQPAARDLRLVMGVAKIGDDLERVGDEAEKIARMMQLFLQADAQRPPRMTSLAHMSAAALALLRQALDAFARQDTAAARRVRQEDSEINERFRGILRELVTYMAESPGSVSACICVLFAAKALERIADHAKNVAEQVSYVVDGQNLRHAPC